MEWLLRTLKFLETGISWHLSRMVEVGREFTLVSTCQIASGGVEGDAIIGIEHGAVERAHVLEPGKGENESWDC